MSDRHESRVPRAESDADDAHESAPASREAGGGPVKFTWTIHTVSGEEGRVVNEAQKSSDR